MDLQTIADAAEQLPLMSEKRCVCVNDFDFEALSESDLKSLTSFCSDLPESTVLIFSQPTLTLDGKKASKTKKFSTVAEKVGTVFHCESVPHHLFPSAETFRSTFQYLEWKSGSHKSLHNVHFWITPVSAVSHSTGSYGTVPPGQATDQG